MNELLFERLVKEPLAALAAGYEAPDLYYLPEEYDGGELRSYCYDHARWALRWRRCHERIREDWGRNVFRLFAERQIGMNFEDGPRYCAVCDEMLDHWLTKYAVEQEIEYYETETSIPQTPREAWALLRFLESAEEHGETLHREAMKCAARVVALWRKAKATPTTEDPERNNPPIPGAIYFCRDHWLCPRCKCCDLVFEDCESCGGEGVYESDDEDYWDDDEYATCEICDGKRGWWMCAARCDEQGQHKKAEAIG